ncbi:MAG: hypothetical protein MJA83_08195 [Gammaproteobacteria bacterium]|nr:hypothetical protein [Gammaproteobacteria bacterium]
MADKSEKAKNLEKTFQELQEQVMEGIHKRDATVEPAPHPNFDDAIAEHVKRDYWTLKEGLNMLCRCHPDKQRWDHGIYELFTLAKSCIGPEGTLKVAGLRADGSLPLISPQSKLKTTPRDLLTWAKTKNIPVPIELESAVFGNHSNAKQVTAKATQSRETKKRDRHRDLGVFLNDIEARSHESNQPITRHSIPATKRQFHEIFISRYPEYSDIKVSTLADDLTDLGVKFKHGTGKQTKNILKSLFD